MTHGAPEFSWAISSEPGSGWRGGSRQWWIGGCWPSPVIYLILFFRSFTSPMNQGEGPEAWQHQISPMLSGCRPPAQKLSWHSWDNWSPRPVNTKPPRARKRGSECAAHGLEPSGAEGHWSEVSWVHLTCQLSWAREHTIAMVLRITTSSQLHPYCHTAIAVLTSLWQWGSVNHHFGNWFRHCLSNLVWTILWYDPIAGKTL